MTDRGRLWAQASEPDILALCQAHDARLILPRFERVALPVAALCETPGGARDRQLLRGEGFHLRAVTGAGWAFGHAERDGYAGWLNLADVALHPADDPTHRIAVSRSYAKPNPGLKATGHEIPLSHGTRVIVLDEADGWSRVAWTRDDAPRDLYIPSGHLAPVSGRETDPVEVAEMFWGTPYLWGGNSSFGIDCSGLVQAACLACGIACPGDSDTQVAALGQGLPEDAPLRRGDLMFWKGHVAWVVDPGTLLHANAFHMAVAYEPLQDAIARIAAQGGGQVRARKRLWQAASL